MADVTGNTNTATILSTNAISQSPESTGLNVNAIGDALNNGYSSPYVFSTNPNALASQWRSNGIPAGAEPNYDVVTVQASYSEPASSKDWRVRISSDLVLGSSDMFAPLTETNGMIFPYLPQITMSHTANYQQMDIAHLNYPFFAYKNSQVDEINITGKFTVQNKTEANYWLASVHFLRTVTKSFVGTGAFLGNPPPICILNGYGDFVYNNVSVIIKNFTVTMPNDVDYIECSGGSTGVSSGSSVSYVPVSSDITVTVQPVYSREKMKKFDLLAFANGVLVDENGMGWV